MCSLSYKTRKFGPIVISSGSEFALQRIGRELGHVAGEQIGVRVATDKLTGTWSGA